MLPSNKRLSRPLFTSFLANKEIKTVFNNLGTLKYLSSEENRVTIIISSKTEKRAVYRNKTKRRIYCLFRDIFSNGDQPRYYALYLSKKSITLSVEEIRFLLYELIKKITK